MNIGRCAVKLLNTAERALSFFGSAITVSLLNSLLLKTTFIFIFCFSPMANLRAQTHESTTQAAQKHRQAPDNPPPFSKQELIAAVANNIHRVEEFQFIIEAAHRLGVRVYLFGGTAAAFGHYVRWDLLRLHGDTQFHPARFDYKYINIYRSTQDLDIVVDGSSGAVSSLQSEIESHFPYMKGSKSEKKAWEVRSLRETIGEKLSLLNNSDFLNQHTDSQSIGLIELTQPNDPRERIRDLRNWDNIENSDFLSDLYEGKIHYYFSELHETTRFALEKRNPPILSVIRYFIKVAQLDLKMRPEDRPILEKIIRDFNPESLNQHSYLPHWFEDNAPKLIQNAVDVEEAVKLIDNFGLREKLQRIGSSSTLNSVAWWMGRKPLASKPIGSNKTKTAADLNISIVSHETTSFLIYEGITRSHKLLPNVLTSRPNYPGEAAVFGEGFYTMIGDRSGYRGSGFTIRFKVHPQAKSGEDFKIVDDYFIVLNRSILQVIPENLSMNLIQYYNWLLSNPSLSQDDLGIYQRLRLAMRPHFSAPSEDEVKYVSSLTQNQLKKLVTMDPSPESRLLLLDRIAKYVNTASEVLNIFSALATWRATLNQVDATEFLDKLKNKSLEDFYKILISQPLNREQIQTAWSLGLFEEHPDKYLELVIPHLSKPEDFNSVWSNIQSGYLVGEKITTKQLRPHLRELIARFFRLNLTPAEFDKGLNGIDHAMKIATYCLDLKDPVVFASLFVMFNASRSLKRGDPVKLWTKMKSKIFDLNPSQVELVEMIHKSLPAVMKNDLLEYYLDHYPARRVSDLLPLIKAIETPYFFDESQKEHERFKQLMLRLSRMTVAASPSINAIQSLVDIPRLPDTLLKEIVALAGENFLTENKLEEFLSNDSINKHAGSFIEKNAELILASPINSHLTNRLFQSVSSNSLKYEIIKSYMKNNPDDSLFLLTQFTEDLQAQALKDIGFFEPLWAKAIDWYFEQPDTSHLKIGPSRILALSPTSAAYRHFLLRYFESNKNDFNVVVETMADVNDNLISNLGHIKNIDKIHQEVFNSVTSQIPHRTTVYLESSRNRRLLGLNLSPDSIFRALALAIQGDYYPYGTFFTNSLHLQFKKLESANRFRELISIYILTQRNTKFAHQNAATFFGTSGTIETLFSAINASPVLFDSPESMILALQKRFFIEELKSQIDSIDQNKPVQLLNLKQKINRFQKDNLLSGDVASQLSRRLNQQVERLSELMQDYAKAHLGEVGSLKDKLTTLINYTKPKDWYIRKIEEELASSESEIASYLASRPHLVETINKVMIKPKTISKPKINECGRALE
jgi:hypothetical protein